MQFWNSVIASWNIANFIHLYRAPNVLKQYQVSWTLKLYPYLKLSDFYYELVRSIFELMKNEFSLWSERRRDIIGRNGRFGCYGGLGMCFFYNLVTVSLPIHMNNHVLINFIESPWIMLINTSWKHLAPGGGGRGGPQQIILRGGSAPRSNPLQFYLPFWQNQSINQSFILTRYVEELENSFKIRTCKKKASLGVNASPLKYKKKIALFNADAESSYFAGAADQQETNCCHWVFH